MNGIIGTFNLNPENNGDLSPLPELSTNNSEGLTNNEIKDILELSFEFLIENKEKLVSKFGGKAFGLLLAESLKNNDSFRENPFLVPNFHAIPTDFYKKNPRNNVNKNDLQSFESLLHELYNFGPNTTISKKLKNWYCHIYDTMEELTIKVQ